MIFNITRHYICASGHVYDDFQYHTALHLCIRARVWWFSISYCTRVVHQGTCMMIFNIILHHSCASDEICYRTRSKREYPHCHHSETNFSSHKAFPELILNKANQILECLVFYDVHRSWTSSNWWATRVVKSLRPFSVAGKEIWHDRLPQSFVSSVPFLLLIHPFWRPFILILHQRTPTSASAEEPLVH
jgi:hypothetical protein